MAWPGKSGTSAKTRKETPRTGPLLICMGVAVAVAGAFRAAAATTPTLGVPPPLEPVVYEFRIERTSQPLSLFNTLPPPLPLKEIRRQKAGRAMPSTAKPATGLRAAAGASTRPSMEPSTSVAAGVLPAQAGTRRSRLSQPRRAFFRPFYPDLIVLTNDRHLRCRLVADRGDRLRVELPNGLVVDFPKHRIKEVRRKRWRK